MFGLKKDTPVKPQLDSDHVVEDLSPVLSLVDKAAFNTSFVASHLIGEKYSERLLSGPRKIYQRRIEKQLRNRRESLSSKRRMVPVMELNDITPQELFENHTSTGVPVVLKGVGKDWAATRIWSLDFFKDRYGDEPVILTNSRQMEHKYKHGIEESVEYTNLADVIDNIRTNGSKYARFHPLLDRHPELLNDLDMKWVKDRMVGGRPGMKPFHNMFIGGKDRATSIHAARTENLYLQVVGKKRWTLWPADYNYLCESDSNRAIYKTSSLDPDDPDLERYPGYQYVDYYETVIEPGDVLYVPGFTWHQVTNLTDTIACTLRWLSPETSFRADPLKAVMALLSTNPSIFEAKKYVEAGGVFDFNHMMRLRVSKT